MAQLARRKPRNVCRQGCDKSGRWISSWANSSISCTRLSLSQPQRSEAARDAQSSTCRPESANFEGFPLSPTVGILKTVVSETSEAIAIIMLFVGLFMKIRLGFLMSFCLIIVGFFLPLVATVPAAANEQTPEEWPMNFALVRNGNCKEICIQWISAEGKITADTPQRFKKLLRSLKGRKLPVVFQSRGGDVDAALSVGRMIRAAGLETAVGRTQLNDCPMLVPRCAQKIVRDGWSEGEVRAGGAYCFSACPLALAGGKVRAAAANAYIGIHQITNGPNRPATGRRNLDAISTKTDPALKRMLSIYLDEMSVNSDDVFAMMGLATPEGLYYVQSAEALKSGVVTKIFSDADEPGYVVRGTGFKTSTPLPLDSDSSLDFRRPDDMCHIINQAYVNTRKTAIYRETVNFVEPDGLRLLAESLMTVAGAFERWGSQSKWARATAPYAVEAYARFTSCTYVDSGEGPHFRAYWHNQHPSQTANADVWLTPDLQRLSKVLRHFPNDDIRYPSKTLLATMDYNATRAVVPSDKDLAQ